MNEQAARINSMHQEEFLWQSIPGNDGILGKCAWRDANVCSKLLAHGGWAPRNEAILEAVLKRARSIKHPWVQRGAQRGST